MARILIIEDNEDFRRLLELHLMHEGFEVASAPNGMRAVQLMAQKCADVIVTDLFMPDKDGIETIVEIRKTYPDTQIVAMSGWQSRRGSDYLEIAREIGAVRTLRKPFEIADLVTLLRQLTTASK